MTNISGVVSYTLKKLWHGVAVLLVVFAVILSLFRYALPQIDKHKVYVQDYVLDEFGVDLDIGSVSATWKGSGPSIVLSDVSLSQIDESPVTFNVDTVWVDIDFWQSISAGILISERFEIHQARLLILPEEFKGGNTNAYPIVDALQNLFLVQLQRFTITDGEVVVKTATTEQTYDLDSLSWVNDGDHHQGKGNIRLRELANNSASFIAELHGGVDQLSGTLYAKAEALDVSPWINEWLTTKFPLQESRANLSAWVNVTDNAFDQIHVELGPSSLEWVGDMDENWLTEINSGSIQALPVDNGWAFRVDQLVVSQDQRTFVTDLIGQADNQGNALINSVKPIPIQPVLAILPLFTGENAANAINDMNPSGELATLQVKWQSQIPSIRAKFLDLAWQSSELVPGLDAVDLEFVWHASQGRIKASASSATLDTRNLLEKPIEQVALDADLFLYFDEDSIQPGWVVNMPRMAINSDILSMELGLQHDLASDFMQAALSIDQMPVEHVPGLLPAPLIGDGTVEYLTRAFAADKGMIEGASVVWSGNPAAFPFADNQGIFQASVAIKDADFLFSSKWPSLTGLDMTLLFENEALYLQSPTGTLDTVELQQLNAVIPRLSSSSGIAISAQGEGTGEQVAELINKSNLEKLGGILTNNVIVDGEVAASLFLNVPFSQGGVTANGKVTLNTADIRIPAIDVDLQGANGLLEFNNSEIFASDIAANLYEQPVAVSLTGFDTGSNYALDVELDGKWNTDQTFARFNVPLTGKVDGDFNWGANVQVFLSDNAMRYEGEIRSDLVGVDSSMPYPLGKSSTQTMPLLVQVSGDKQTSTLSVNLGSQAQFDGVLQHKPMTFTRSRLALGRESGLVPAGDHTVQVSLPTLNVDEWKNLKHAIDSEHIPSSEKTTPLLPTPERILIESDVVTSGPFAFDNARVNAHQENLHWRIDVASKQAAGLLVVPANWRLDGVSVFAEKLYLNPSVATGPKDTQEAISQTVDFPLRFRCDDCGYNDYRLGKVDLELRPVDDGVSIDRLNINHPHGSLMASGGWQSGSDGQTQITGQFKSGDFGQWLDAFAFSSGIKDSEADIEFKLGWKGTPSDFDVASLSGDMDWELSDGYLTQVSDQGSRIFTLFSLNSLVRKLSLDFRDVFAQGFFYDKIDGTLRFENGKAMTTDTVVDGGAGEIEIVGFTQLDTEELNYNISFTPNVTGNLPFLVYFLANPPTAIAALALDQMLTSAKVISNINYQVSGTFSDPVVTEVGRDSKDIALPASQPVEKEQPQALIPLDEAELQRVKLNVSDS